MKYIIYYKDNTYLGYNGRTNDVKEAIRFEDYDLAISFCYEEDTYILEVAD